MMRSRIVVALISLSLIIPLINGCGQDADTVTDKATGLMWQKEDDDVERNWADANSYCEGLSLAGHSDWRLPAQLELESIVDLTVTEPKIDKSKFPNTKSSYYWSSTTVGGVNSTAWQVDFRDGIVSSNFKSMDYNVRCVRGGPVR